MLLPRVFVFRTIHLWRVTDLLLQGCRLTSFIEGYTTTLVEFARKVRSGGNRLKAQHSHQPLALAVLLVIGKPH